VGVVTDRLVTTPGFSVVIATYQRRERLRMVLERLGRQEYPTDRLEIIVVCDGCTDGSAEMARGMKLRFRVHVLEQANAGPAVARNLGLEHARGPWVLFLDDDVMPAPSFVGEHALAHGGRKDRVVIGPLLAAPGRARPWVAWEARKLVEQYGKMEAGVYEPTPYQFYTGNASVSLEAVRGVGGFDPQYLRAEDIELALRLQRSGMHFCFAPSASAIHLADRSYASWLRAAYQYGHNDVAFATGATGHSLDRLTENTEERHPAMRAAIRFGLRHGRARAWIVAAAGVVAAAVPGQIGQWACSTAFNLEYWRGVSEAMGDETRALALVEGAQVA